MLSLNPIQYQILKTDMFEFAANSDDDDDDGGGGGDNDSRPPNRSISPERANS